MRSVPGRGWLSVADVVEDAPGLAPGSVLWLRRLDADAARWSPELVDEVEPEDDGPRWVFLTDDPNE